MSVLSPSRLILMVRPVVTLLSTSYAGIFFRGSATGCPYPQSWDSHGDSLASGGSGILRTPCLIVLQSRWTIQGSPVACMKLADCTSISPSPSLPTGIVA